jgi:ADP-ribose pyrophosphatase YjhB (NUDIX family)
MEGAMRPPDLPVRAGPVRRLHLLAGNLAIFGLDLFRPRLMLGVRVLALDDGGRVFLVRHSYVPGWYLPGGAVERGETAREAAVREAREEGCLELDAPPELFHLYWSRQTGRRDHIVLFVARNVRQASDASRAGVEVREAGFFEPGALPEAATRATRDRIAEVLGGEPPSDLW